MTVVAVSLLFKVRVRVGVPLFNGCFESVHWRRGWKVCCFLASTLCPHTAYCCPPPPRPPRTPRVENYDTHASLTASHLPARTQIDPCCCAAHDSEQIYQHHHHPLQIHTRHTQDTRSRKHAIRTSVCGIHFLRRPCTKKHLQKGDCCLIGGGKEYNRPHSTSLRYTDKRWS